MKDEVEPISDEGLAKLRDLLSRATPGPYDTLRGDMVRAIRQDLAIPIFEAREPFADPDMPTPTVRLGREVIFRAGSQGARESATQRRVGANTELVAAVLNALPSILARISSQTEARERAEGWRSVDDDPPQQRVLVLLFWEEVAGIEACTDLGWLSGEEWQNTRGRSFGVVAPNAWMPLPAPPSKGTPQ